VRAAVWRGLDEPRMEIAHVESWERARGTQIGVAYEVRWELEGHSLRLEHGPPRDYMMSFVRVPELTAEPSRQLYEPLGGRAVRYRSGGFEADIEFDAGGLVTLYHGYLERIA
jgi:uncharacterized protein